MKSDFLDTGVVLFVVIVILLLPVIGQAQGDAEPESGVIWSGSDPKMSLSRLAAYCGPILWFSPDEPLLHDSTGTGIRIPEAFPFENHPDAPVVYYRLRTVLTDPNATGPGFTADPSGKDNIILDLSKIWGLEMDYFFYYSSEEGLGGHKHDVESAEFKISVWPHEQCDNCPYTLSVSKVIAKAHGVLWFDNTLDIDKYTRFPMTLLVEEGKHASCTDKNGDGYYTPGYDVNRRVNDAWGVRDVIRSGSLFAAGFASWMAKVRQEEHRVFPPLPEDSPVRDRYVEGGEYAPDNAKYELRPWPTVENPQPDLVRFLDKGHPNWPKEDAVTDIDKLVGFLEAETFVKSLSLSLRLDGDVGLSFVFPFFIVKNLEDPVAGGYITHRMYLKDKGFRDFGWMLHYTPSASRWMDSYFSAGYESDREPDPEREGKLRRDRHFVLETGLKFRVNIAHTPVGFLSKLTDFWGFRLGIKNKGFFDIERLTYVLEVGAGVW